MNKNKILYGFLCALLMGSSAGSAIAACKGRPVSACDTIVVTEGEESSVCGQYYNETNNQHCTFKEAKNSSNEFVCSGSGKACQ